MLDWARMLSSCVSSSAQLGRLGVDALVGEDAPLRAMLTPYVSPPKPSESETGEDGRALEDLLLDIAAGIRFRTSVTKEADGWVARIVADAAPPRIPEGTRVTIAPHNRPAETYPLNREDPIDVALLPRELVDITAFLRLTASRKADGDVLERSTVVCSRLEGSPDERFREILARQIDTPEKFLQLLALLIGFAAGTRHQCQRIERGDVKLVGRGRTGCPRTACACSGREP